MEDDNLSLLSEQNSIDPDRASIEAERQSLYGDTDTPSETLSHAMTQTSGPSVRSPKVQEAAPGFFDRARGQNSTHPDTEPLRDAGPAPPDYAAATADARYRTPAPYPPAEANSTYGSINSPPIRHQHDSHNIHQDYSTPTHWLRSGPHYISEERTGLIATYPSKRKQRGSCCGGCCGRICWIFCRLLFLAAAILFLLTVFGVFDDHNNTSVMPPDDGQVKLPISEDLDGHGRRAHTSTSRCQYRSYSKATQFDFDNVASFSLLERLKKDEDFYGDIGGYVWLVPASKQTLSAQNSDLRVWTSIATTDPWTVTEAQFVKGDDSLEIKFPELNREGDRRASRACLHVAMVIMVKEGVSLQALNISTVHFDVKTFDNLTDIGLELDESYIDAVSGEVSLKYWSSRETRISTVSGNVSGLYALRDLLDITTVSGKVTVDIDPKKVDSQHPAPAKYLVRTTSGNVWTNIPTLENVPDRDYQVFVESRSGNIEGSYLFQTSATLKSVSGYMDVNFLPYDSSARSIKTETTSGNQRLDIGVSYIDPARAIKQLTSFHGTMSGKLRLAYPETWEGTLEGDTISGKVTLEGRHLEGAETHDGFFQKHFSASKGNGDSHVRINTISGNVEARIGDV